MRAHSYGLQGGIESEGVYDSGKHAHLVALDAVEAFGGSRKAAEDISAADNDADLDSACRELSDLFGV